MKAKEKTFPALIPNPSLQKMPSDTFRLSTIQCRACHRLTSNKNFPPI